MKKIIFFLFLALLITGLAAAQASAGGTMYVAINTIDLKDLVHVHNAALFKNVK